MRLKCKTTEVSRLTQMSTVGDYVYGTTIPGRVNAIFLADQELQLHKMCLECNISVFPEHDISVRGFYCAILFTGG